MISQLINKANAHLSKTFPKSAANFHVEGHVDGPTIKLGTRGYVHVSFSPNQIVSFSPTGDKMIASLVKKGLTFETTQTYSL